MPRSLLQLVQQAQAELGLFPLPTIIAGATDDTSQQMMALANLVGGDVFNAKEDGWTALQTEFVINIRAPTVTTGTTSIGSAVITGIPIDVTPYNDNWIVQGPGLPGSSRVVAVAPGSITVNQLATGGAGTGSIALIQDTFNVPPDFAGFVNDTQWDRTMHWRLIGPVTAQHDQYLRGGIVATGPRRRWRQIGRAPSVFRVWPPPTATDTPAALVFEYNSNFWATAADGITAQPQFVLDTDTCVYPDSLVVSGLKWRMWQHKGFASDHLKDDFLSFQDIAMAADGGNPKLYMARRPGPWWLLGGAAVPETGFGPGTGDFTLDESQLDSPAVLG